ncbi:MAG: class I SAM-dependent methyltransferase [Myxococcota bacterium]|nr:class I SAM-dependent methyltransferase [Myxococcota bacterium]
MDDRTARALNRINAAFYRERADAFSATREGAWTGWQRLQDVLAKAGLPGDARVLDVGCGNARLGRFLAERQPDLRYTGVDASAELLALARERGGLGPEPALLAVDLVEGDLAAALGEQCFDLAACFGLLHHLPARARRKALLSLLLERLAPGGLLAVTCWRLALFARFQKRVIPWASWNESTAEPIDPAQLEPGDHLLPFGESDQPRYVHFAHQDETAEILAELGANVIDTWVADGQGNDLNRYFVVQLR